MSPEVPRTAEATGPPEFAIDDAKSFDENLIAFLGSLTAHDPVLAAVAERELPRLMKGQTTPAALLNALKQALEAQGG